MIQIGTDEWVKRYKERLSEPAGLQRIIARIVAKTPLWVWLIALTGVGLLVPALSPSAYVVRIAGSVVLMAILGAGLNIVAGSAGLLNLGYIAFYGIGAYAYAYLSSDFSGLHLPSLLSLPLIVMFTAAVGLLLGLVSLRLSGDYLAMATLGFGLVFVQLITNLNRVEIGGQVLDLTGGPNGILKLDGLGVGSFRVETPSGHYVVMLLVLVLTLTFVYRLHRSRIGRAWRALREDELAAEMMGIPTRRLKLLAFLLSAGIAGLAGGLFAGWQQSVFPSSFEIDMVISLYAALILGGLGSLPGVLIGAVVLTGLPEILRNLELASAVLYAGLALGIWRAFGKAALLHIIILALLWQIEWTEAYAAGNIAFAALLVLLVLAARAASARLRFILFIPAVVLAVIAWETRLLFEPGATRLILLGGMLVILMIHRPQGIFGKPRVEVI